MAQNLGKTQLGSPQIVSLHSLLSLLYLSVWWCCVSTTDTETLSAEPVSSGAIWEGVEMGSYLSHTHTHTQIKRSLLFMLSFEIRLPTSRPKEAQQFPEASNSTQRPGNPTQNALWSFTHPVIHLFICSNYQFYYDTDVSRAPTMEHECANATHCVWSKLFLLQIATGLFLAVCRLSDSGCIRRFYSLCTHFYLGREERGNKGKGSGGGDETQCSQLLLGL